MLNLPLIVTFCKWEFYLFIHPKLNPLICSYAVSKKYLYFLYLTFYNLLDLSGDYIYLLILLQAGCSNGGTTGGIPNPRNDGSGKPCAFISWTDSRYMIVSTYKVQEYIFRL